MSGSHAFFCASSPKTGAEAIGVAVAVAVSAVVVVVIWHAIWINLRLQLKSLGHLQAFRIALLSDNRRS